ncbi:hypothetical protein Pmani_020000 [Petrolisthes manimaculis]|uniref:Uncharacterized protein n=1 Tax=Petrolisthes manimaculis TaxID=1843537 RepID=A0AAE1U310_9EUCA|nr:hypothetical protein Pmani_020000 [Petrolisthes manimaculis]
MFQATCTVVLAVVVAASLAAEQVGSREARSAPAASEVPTWVQAMWRPEEEWGNNQEEDEAGWAPEDTLDDASLEDVEISQPQVGSWLAKRQPPRSLGSLMDLYRTVAHGLSPFVAQPRNHVLSASPQRRSARRPAACRFGTFGLVCWRKHTLREFNRGGGSIQ